MTDKSGPGLPAFNPELTADERAAVAAHWARGFADATMREAGIDAARVDRERLEAEAINLLLAHWLEKLAPARVP